MPNNLPLAAVGAGVLWLGWNGFNGGDPYFAGGDGKGWVSAVEGLVRIRTGERGHDAL